MTHWDDALEKHIRESLALLPAVDKALSLSGGQTDVSQRLLDVGTGAGFPGVVLAVARDPLQVTALFHVRNLGRPHYWGFLASSREVLSADSVQRSGH